MCIDITDLVTTDVDIVVYKTVDVHRWSRTLARTHQRPWDRLSWRITDGLTLTRLHYADGELVFSPIPETPGLYCAPTLMGALVWHCAPHSIILQCVIPAGTQMLVGHTITRAELTYCPELLYVSHEVPQAEVAQAERLVERRGLLRRAFGPSSSD